MSIVKIKDHNDLVKDTKTGAILMAVHDKANEYEARKKILQNDKDLAAEINTIKERLHSIEQMQTEISDIKSLLQQIASNGN